MKGYDLRYAQADKDSYWIVINQHRTLICLDALMLHLDEPFSMRQSEKALQTPIQHGISSNDKNLITDNTAISPGLLQEVLKRTNKVIELGIGKRFINLLVAYETDGVSMSGDFLKEPNFQEGKAEFQLTFG